MPYEATIGVTVSTPLRVTDAMNILQLFSVGAKALVRPRNAFIIRIRSFWHVIA